MKRLSCSIALAAILLLQPAIVLAAPTPSPGLDGVLIKPTGTGYVEQAKPAPGIVEGPFDAAKYAEITSAPNASATEQALARAGFLSGYGRTWVTSGNAHVFVEAVMVFTGAKGATSWLRQSEAADKADPNYAQALTVAGIDTYYGARLIDKVHKIYGDAFVFAKGNDLMLVTFASNKNDLATIAATQTKRQFDAAPPFTIPPAEWPESQVSSTSAVTGLKTIGLIVGAIIVLGLIAAAGVILWTRRRPSLGASLQDPPGFVSATAIGAPPASAASSAAVIPMAAALPAAAAPPVMEGPFVMSEDRLAWWDGAAWRDAEHEVPPAAQRSEDGQFWWDGEAWRPMPPSPFGG